MIARRTAPRASGNAGRLSGIAPPDTALPVSAPPDIALPSRVRPVILAILFAVAGLVLLARAF